MSATKRLTRAESRERTRSAIVAAATKLFLRDGYGVTSLDQVADDAGFTIGAVYSNFEGKAALGNAVIDELYAREERKLAAIGHEPGSDAWLRARCAELLAPLTGPAPGTDIELLATAIVGLALGIGAQRAADPAVSGSTFSEALRALAGRQSDTNSA